MSRRPRAEPHSRRRGCCTSQVILSFVVGILRGRLTRVWVEADRRVLRQGTRVTIALFVGLIATKFALGTLA